MGALQDEECRSDDTWLRGSLCFRQSRLDLLKLAI
jgi:hypothetical protein